jgi:regulatory Fis family protein
MGRSTSSHCFQKRWRLWRTRVPRISVGHNFVATASACGMGTESQICDGGQHLPAWPVDSSTLKGGNMSRAAEQLGLHRSNLYRKMRQLGMNVEE